MSSFSEANFSKKLVELNATQSSIQTLALWLIHHRKHSGIIVQTWMKGIRKAKPSKKLTFLYLANDVIQNSKKKGPEFNRDFRIVIIDAYRHCAKHADYKTRQSMERVLGIWKERAVFDQQFLDKCRKAMGEGIGGKDESPASEATPTVAMAASLESDGSASEPESKKPKPEKATEKSQPDKGEGRENRKRKKEMSLKEEMEQELVNGPNEPPEPEDLVKALQDLENSASSDAAVRERIAALPPEVSDINLLEKLRDKGDADELGASVSEAVSLLTSYNGRLSSELQDRKKVAGMLRDYITSQKTQLGESEEKLKEYKSKLAKVDVVRRELKAHIQSLPDLTMLPDVTGGLAPLPSAGDLFHANKDT